MTSADMYVPAYVRVADDLAARIAAGELTGLLPGERTLAQDYGVSYGTMRHAAQVLRERGLITTRPVAGSFTAAGALPGPQDPC